MANLGMTAVECRHCGQQHQFTPTALAAILIAFQDGDGQRVTGLGTLESLCLVDVLQNGIPPTDPRRDGFRGTVAHRFEPPARGRPRGIDIRPDQYLPPEYPGE